MDTTLKTLEQSERANLFEAQSMKAVFEYIQSRPQLGPRVVAFDLDNTIMQPAQTLGSDQWFVQHLNQESGRTENKTLALSNTVALYNQIQHQTTVSPVEVEVIEMIQKLQQAGCIVIGLTARGKILADTTAKQLLSIGVNFNQGQFANIEAPCASNPENGIFKHGIMFVDGKSKGEALKGLMKSHQINPHDVYFMDDSLRHIHDVKAHSDADYTGIHYTHVKEIKGLNVDLSITEMQIKYLNVILPDKVAKAVHEHHESEVSNTHLKITFKQKEAVYKPYGYFWGNHQQDYKTILSFFNPEQCEPKIKHDFYNFKKDHPVMAYRFKVPLEKTAPLISFLYDHKVYTERDQKEALHQLGTIEETNRLAKLNLH